MATYLSSLRVLLGNLDLAGQEENWFTGGLVVGSYMLAASVVLTWASSQTLRGDDAVKMSTWLRGLLIGGLLVGGLTLVISCPLVFGGAFSEISFDVGQYNSGEKTLFAFFIIGVVLAAAATTYYLFLFW